MDSFVKHWGALPRKFPSACPLLTVGDVRAKNHWERRSFSTCNFSLILRGRGEYWCREKLWVVQAPYVITQWPHEPLAYGPPVPTGTWDELYLIYDAACLPGFRQSGFMDENAPAWPIRNLERVMAQVEELRALAGTHGSEMTADRVDRIAERLILESLLPGIRPGPETSDEVVQHILQLLRNRPQHPYDFDQLARQHGLSPSTLRRRWYNVLKTTPGRYLLDLRIRKARRLLAETSLKVGEIAAETGFEDMLYFSRRFKLETKLSPSQYRANYRIKPL